MDDTKWSRRSVGGLAALASGAALGLLNPRPAAASEPTVQIDVVSVRSIDQLRSVPISGEPDRTAIVLGYSKPGDGGQGIFFWDAESEAAVNRGSVVASNHSARGRWIRVLRSIV